MQYSILLRIVVEIVCLIAAPLNKLLLKSLSPLISYFLFDLIEIKAPPQAHTHK